MGSLTRPPKIKFSSMDGKSEGKLDDKDHTTRENSWHRPTASLINCEEVDLRKQNAKQCDMNYGSSTDH
jgi:hypothetical protein